MWKQSSKVAFILTHPNECHSSKSLIIISKIGKSSNSKTYLIVIHSNITIISRDIYYHLFYIKNKKKHWISISSKMYGLPLIFQKKLCQILHSMTANIKLAYLCWNFMSVWWTNRKWKRNLKNWKWFKIETSSIE